MRKLLLIAALGLNLAAAALVGKAWQARTTARALLLALPPAPDLSHWPRVFADRVQLDTAAAQGGGDTFGAIKELALLYHANGFQKEADRLEREILRQSPADPQWAYYLADLRLAAGDSAEAEALLTETLRLKPDYDPAELRLGDLLLRSGRSLEAARHYEARLRHRPDDPYSQLGLARLALQGGDGDNAIAKLETLVRTSPQFGTAHNLLGEIYRTRGEAEKSAEHCRLGTAAGRFREADDPWLAQLAEWSYDPYRLQVLGATQMQTGHLEASLPFYEKSVRLNPSDGLAYDALADVYLQLNRVDDAQKIAEKGLIAAPKTRELYTTLSQILRKQNRNQEAITLLQRGLATLPENPELYNDLGVALEAAARRSEAANAYGSAVRLDPGLAQAQLNLGLCLLELGQRPEAEARIQRALELRPSDSNALLALAQTELDAGRAESAARFASVLRTYRPEMPEARHLLALADLQLGTLASKSGESEKAERWFRDGLKEDDTVPELYANLGALLSQRSNYSEALPAFKQFVALAPRETIAYIYLGQVYLATARFPEATATFEHGLRLAQEKGDHDLQARLESLLDRARKGE